MTRYNFKKTEQVKNVMLVVAEQRDKSVSDLIHEYFYQLAVTDLLSMNTNDEVDTELSVIFSDAMRL